MPALTAVLIKTSESGVFKAKSTLFIYFCSASRTLIKNHKFNEIKEFISKRRKETPIKNNI